MSDAHAETPALVNSMCGLVSTAALHALLDIACRNIQFILFFRQRTVAHTRVDANMHVPPHENAVCAGVWGGLVCEVCGWRV